MKIRHLAAALLACLAFQGRAAEPKLRPKHAKAGLTCFRCHGEEAPSKAPSSSDSCMDCHGDLPAMAAYSKSSTVNPHAVPKAPHPGPFACAECHRQHKDPVVKCLECHPSFKLTPR